VDGPAEEKEGDRGDQLTLNHVNNFLRCMDSRERPNGDVLFGHRSAQASHLGNVAFLEGKRIEFDPVREVIIDR
jgi:hypothetical protein